MKKVSFLLAVILAAAALFVCQAYADGDGSYGSPYRDNAVLYFKGENDNFMIVRGFEERYVPEIPYPETWNLDWKEAQRQLKIYELTKQVID